MSMRWKLLLEKEHGLEMGRKMRINRNMKHLCCGSVAEKFRE